MKLTRFKFQLMLLVALFAMVFSSLAQTDTNAISKPGLQLTPDFLTDLVVQAGVVIVPLLGLSAYLKNACPKFPNGYIPLFNLVVGWLAFFFLHGDHSGTGAVLSLIVALSVVGIHSSAKNTGEAVGIIEKKVPLILLFGLSLAVFGSAASCRPVTVKAGSDPIVVQAEWLAENSLNTFDSFFEWERTHDQAKLPVAIRSFATSLRGNNGQPGKAALAVKELRSATKLYKQAKTSASGDEVKALTAALLQLANQALQLQGLPPLKLPAASPSATDLMGTNAMARPPTFAAVSKTQFTH